MRMLCIQKYQQGKLFIGGLHVDTDKDSLREYFETYGTVVDAVVMSDPHTKNSRGFGFITYDDAANAKSCLDSCPHVVDDKQVSLFDYHS